jgi:hypothetical protein
MTTASSPSKAIELAKVCLELLGKYSDAQPPMAASLSTLSGLVKGLIEAKTPEVLGTPEQWAKCLPSLAVIVDAHACMDGDPVNESLGCTGQPVVLAATALEVIEALMHWTPVAFKWSRPEFMCEILANGIFFTSSKTAAVIASKCKTALGEVVQKKRGVSAAQTALPPDVAVSLHGVIVYLCQVARMQRAVCAALREEVMNKKASGTGAKLLELSKMMQWVYTNWVTNSVCLLGLARVVPADTVDSAVLLGTMVGCLMVEIQRIHEVPSVKWNYAKIFRAAPETHAILDPASLFHVFKATTVALHARAPVSDDSHTAVLAFLQGFGHNENSMRMLHDVVIKYETGVEAIAAAKKLFGVYLVTFFETVLDTYEHMTQDIWSVICPQWLLAGKRVTELLGPLMIDSLPCFVEDVPRATALLTKLCSKRDTPLTGGLFFSFRTAAKRRWARHLSDSDYEVVNAAYMKDQEMFAERKTLNLDRERGRVREFLAQERDAVRDAVRDADLPRVFFRERDSDRDRDRDRDCDRDRDRDRRTRERDLDRDRDRDRGSRDKSRDRSRERLRDKSRDRLRDKSRDKSTRYKSRSRSRSRDRRTRDRDREFDASRDKTRDDKSRTRDTKDTRKDIRDSVVPATQPVLASPKSDMEQFFAMYEMWKLAQRSGVVAAPAARPTAPFIARRHN